MENNIENKNENKSILQTFADELKQNMLKNTMLGYEIGKMQTNYYFKDIVEFLKGNTEECFNYCKLKPLYDKYGYEITNNAILQVQEECNEKQKEQNENE